MIKGGDEKGDEESASVCDSGGAMTLLVKVDIPEPIVGGMRPEPKTGSRQWTSRR